MKVRELELEVERLSSRAEHLRAQNDVLSLTLSESRAMGERLAVLLGKYESNCMALRLALERADRVSEAFEVLVALVESEMSLLLANCQMAVSVWLEVDLYLVGKTAPRTGVRYGNGPLNADGLRKI